MASEGNYPRGGVAIEPHERREGANFATACQKKGRKGIGWIKQIKVSITKFQLDKINRLHII